MIFQVDMGGEARVILRQFSPLRKQKIKECLRAIAKNPYLGKALQENLNGYRTFRVGSFRIVYSINFPQKIVNIVAIGPRESIYSELEKKLLLRKILKE